MKIFKFLIVFFTFCIICSCSYASSTNITFSEQEVNPSDEVELIITLNLDTIEDNISVLQGQLDYDKSIFKVVTEENIETLNGWTGLVFNKDNGMFIIDRTTPSSNSSEQILKIKLEIIGDITSETTTTFKLTNTKVIGSSREEISLDDNTATLKITPSLLDSLANTILPYTGLITSAKHWIISLSLITCISLIIICLKLYKRRK